MNRRLFPIRILPPPTTRSARAESVQMWTPSNKGSEMQRGFVKKGGWFTLLTKWPRCALGRWRRSTSGSPGAPPLRHAECLAAGRRPPRGEPRPWLPTGPAEQEQVSAWRQAQGLRTDASPCFTPGAALVGRASAGGQEAGIDAGRLLGPRARELGRRARFAVTNDSGPMHVLSCAGIPLYAFFGPTSAARSHALGQRQRVLVHPVPCSPCWLPVCPRAAPTPACKG